MFSNDFLTDQRMEELYKKLTSEGKKLAERKAGEHTAHLYFMENDFYEIYFRSNNQPDFAWKHVKDEWIDLYLDAELERKIKLMQEPVLIPVCCPFTDAPVYDDEGYHEPYVESLVLIYNDFDDLNWYGPCKTMEEIMELVIEFHNRMEINWKSPVMKEMLGILKKQPHWIDWKMVIEGEFGILSDLIIEHPLVVVRHDENDYDHFMESNVSYYFADEAGRKKIRDGLQATKLILETYLER